MKKSIRTDGLEYFYAQLEAAEAGADDNVFKFVAYSGKPVPSIVFKAGKIISMPLVIDLAGVSLARYTANPVVLREHNPADVVGLGVEVTNDGSQCRASILLTDCTDCARETLALVKKKCLRTMSWAVRVLKEEEIQDGVKFSCNGRELSGPMRVAREIELVELSIVALPRDDEALRYASYKHIDESQPNNKEADNMDWEKLYNELQEKFAVVSAKNKELETAATQKDARMQELEKMSGLKVEEFKNLAKKCGFDFASEHFGKPEGEVLSLALAAEKAKSGELALKLKEKEGASAVVPFGGVPDCKTEEGLATEEKFSASDLDILKNCGVTPDALKNNKKE